MADVFSINCKNCGASAHFDPRTQKIKCDSCNQTYKLSEYNESDDVLEDGDEEYSFETQNINIKDFVFDSSRVVKSGQAFDNDSEEKVSAYICEQCGAEVITSSVSGTAKCPYCDNNLVFTDKFEGILRPDLIIPFKKTKEDALEAYEAFLKKRSSFIPSIFKKENHIEEIQGVYVPYWIYDADFELKYLYKTKSVEENEILLFTVTTTSFFDVIREGTISYKDLPRDASSRMRDDLMDSLEPFDIKEAEDFSTYYIAGYLAERFDVPAEDCVKDAIDRMKKTITKEVENTIKGYDEVKKAGEEVKLLNGKVRYGLYPVWYLSTSYKNKKYSFAMNGQTGKVVSDNLPIDWVATIIVGIIISFITGLILGLFGACALSFAGFVVLWFIGVLIGIGITFGMVRKDLVSIEKKAEAKEYISDELKLSKKQDKLKKKRTKIRLSDSD